MASHPTNYTEHREPKGKAPAFQFYTGDWMKDPELRSISVTARGVWMDLLCLMHDGARRGFLQNRLGIGYSNEQLARMVGTDINTFISSLREIEESGVSSREESAGILFSRRMYRDEEIRKKRASSGSLGGNPKLVAGYNKPGFVYLARRSSDGAVRIGIATNPQNRLYKLRFTSDGDEINLAAAVFVSDMGRAEAEVHSKYADARITGSWFDLGEKGCAECEIFLKGKWGQNSTPSSSSSSSSSTSVVNTTPPTPSSTSGETPGTNTGAGNDHSPSQTSFLEETQEKQKGKPSARPNIRDEFEEDWKFFWLKVGKEAACKAYTKARKLVNREVLMERVKALGPVILESAKQRRITPIHPATWLNAGGWDDEQAAYKNVAGSVATRADFVPRKTRQEIASEELMRRIARESAREWEEINGKAI